ncbi:MAG: DoxX family membrane protein [Actinomycetota bacterium]|nr:DoxX family membrane protein [Actinomycetota bacterium]
MTLTRWVARPMLASVFVSSGIDTLRNPSAKVETAEPVATKVASRLPLPNDTEKLVKINAGVQIGAGFLLAIGRLPRLAALALAGSIVPTTLAGHRFWEAEDKATKAQQQVQFMKNTGLLGGLLLAAVDTGGAPSLTWRAKRAARRARDTASVMVEHLPVA